jgi:hypothetical protein
MDLSRADGGFALGEDGARRARRCPCSAAHARPGAARRRRLGHDGPRGTWRKALEEAMAEARIDLDAVLVRTTRSLRDLEALGPGDLIGFEPADLASVRLETPSGSPCCAGGSARSAGQRALRMTAGSGGLMPPVGAALPGAGIAATRPSHLDGAARHFAAPRRMSMEDTGTPPIARTRARLRIPVHGAGAPAARTTRSRRKPRRWISRLRPPARPRRPASLGGPRRSRAIAIAGGRRQCPLRTTRRRDAGMSS